jgi:hypothetical protein
MMLSFSINYEDAKKLLEVFYNSPYKNVLPYVEIMHNMQEINGSLSLKERLDIEVKNLNQVEPVGE